MRPLTAKRNKQKEIRELQKHLERLRVRSYGLTHVAAIREYLHKVAEINMRIAILRGEIEY